MLSLMEALYFIYTWKIFKVEEQDIQTNIFDTSFIGSLCYHYHKVESTNLLLSNWVKNNNNLINGLLITANYQTAGKGRLNRKWHSKEGKSLLFSFLLQSDKDKISEITSLPLVIGLSISECLENVYGLDTKVKWPNDIYVRNKKISGILCQTIVSQCVNSIVGIGFNVNQNLDDFSDDIKNTASSLYLETGKTHERLLVLKYMIQTIEKYYFLYKNKGFTSLKDKILERLYLFGETVTIKDIVGKIVGISDNGALKLFNTKSKIIEIYSGDVENVISN